MLCIVVHHNCQTHVHRLYAVNNVLYNVGCVLIDFNINRCIVGRVLPGKKPETMVSGGKGATVPPFWHDYFQPTRKRGG